MKCIVTAGPTYEPLDEVRRLTNFSTGQLGAELADFLVQAGHETSLLMGHYATWRGPLKAQRTETFTTTADLRERLRSLAAPDIGAVFHAAAVSDFGFGQIFEQGKDGSFNEVKTAKLSSRQGRLLAQLVPTPKILVALREWYPEARLVGWKYELDGDRVAALERAYHQVDECRTDACVVNGRAYGEGFGLVKAGADWVHCPDRKGLFEALAGLLKG